MTVSALYRHTRNHHGQQARVRNGHVELVERARCVHRSGCSNIPKRGESPTTAPKGQQEGCQVRDLEQPPNSLSSPQSISPFSFGSIPSPAGYLPSDLCEIDMEPLDSDITSNSTARTPAQCNDKSVERAVKMKPDVQRKGEGVKPVVAAADPTPVNRPTRDAASSPTLPLQLPPSYTFVELAQGYLECHPPNAHYAWALIKKTSPPPMSSALWQQFAQDFAKVRVAFDIMSNYMLSGPPGIESPPPEITRRWLNRFVIGDQPGFRWHWTQRAERGHHRDYLP